MFFSRMALDHMGGRTCSRKRPSIFKKESFRDGYGRCRLGRKIRWLLEAIDPGDILRVVDLARQGRLVSLEGAREDVLPYIDLYPAHESHTPGSQYVVIRNDGKRDLADAWVMAGDLNINSESPRQQRSRSLLRAGRARKRQPDQCCSRLMR